jgi:hypothetical protein
MKGLLFIIGGIAAVLWLTNEEQHAASSGTASPNTAIHPAAILPTAALPAAILPAATTYPVGGGGGGYFESPGGGGGNESALRMYGSSIDEFYLLDLLSRSQEPSYRDQYPNAPGVINVNE